MAFLEAQHITKIFISADHEIPALQDINFTIDHAEFLAITGPSGSGKSTLMHLIGCLDTPTQGRYLMDGRNTSDMEPDELAHIRNKKIGFVFQKFNLLPDLTALENVALPQLYGNEPESKANEKAKEMLEIVKLGHRINHFPYQLSGGEQQRVAIARAMVNDPAIILADEPTGNLDSKTGLLIVNNFIHLNTEHRITIIFVTHNLELAKKTNRIIKLLDGHIVDDEKLR